MSRRAPPNGRRRTRKRTSVRAAEPFFSRIDCACLRRPATAIDLIVSRGVFVVLIDCSRRSPSFSRQSAFVIAKGRLPRRSLCYRGRRDSAAARSGCNRCSPANFVRLACASAKELRGRPRRSFEIRRESAAAAYHVEPLLEGA